jgi:hypothetical protein
MDKARFLGIVKRLFDDDRTALDMDLSAQFNEFLKVGVQNKWIAFEDSSNLSRGLNQKREKLYKTPVIGPDGTTPTKKITRPDGTSVTRPMTMVDLLQYRQSNQGGLYGGYKLPEGSIQQFKGMAPTEELNKQAPPADWTTLGKRDIMRQQLQQAQFNAQREAETKGTQSMTAGRYAAIGAGGLLGMVRGVGAPLETLIRKGLGQSREEILQSQFGSGTSDVDDPFNFGGDRTKFIGQKFTQQVLPTLTGLATGAALAVPAGALFNAPGALAGFIGGGIAGSTAANEAQNALVNAIMGTRTVIGKDGKKQVVGFMDDVAGLQAEEAEKNPFGEFVAEALPNLIAGKPKLPTFLNPAAIRQGIGAGTAGAKAMLAAERVAVGPKGAGSLIERGYAASLAKLPKLAAANQAIATSKVGRSIKGWNAGINQLAQTQGAIGQEFGEEASEFAVEVAQGLYDRNQLIRENEARKANGEEPVEVPGYFEILRDAVVGASFEGETRLQRRAFDVGGAMGNRALGLMSSASQKLTGQSLNPYVQSISGATNRVNPITRTPTATTGTPATPGAHPVTTDEAADMFRGFTAASGERVIPIGSGQFGVVNAEGRISRVVEASEIDPTVFTPRGASTTSGTTEAHVASAGTLLSRSGLFGGDFKPIGADKETVIGTTDDGYAIRRTVQGDKIDVRVVSPDVLQPENRRLAEAHMNAAGITPTDKTGFTASTTYAEEHTLNRAMLGRDTPAANSYDAAFDTDIAIDSGFTVRGRVVGKAKVRGREVNTHYVVQVPSGNGQVDTVVVPAQNIVLRDGQKINIHPVMNAGDTNDVLRYSQLTADDVSHDPAKMNSGKFTAEGLGDGVSPVMLTPDQAEAARSGREAISRNADTVRARGADPTRSTAVRQGNLRRSVRGTIAESDTTYKRGDYIEHTDYEGKTASGVVVANTPHGPLIAPLDGSPAYVAQPSTITYTQSDADAAAPSTPTPEEAAAAAIAETGGGGGGGGEDDREKVIDQKIRAMSNEERQDVWKKMIQHILSTVKEEDAGNADFDATEMGAAIGVDPDIVEGIMGLAELTLSSYGTPLVQVSPTGSYDFTNIFKRQKEIDAAKAAAAAGTGTTPDTTATEPETSAADEELTGLPATFSESAAEAGPQEGRERDRSTGEVEARNARPAEEQEEKAITMALKDVTLNENESEAVAEFSAIIGSGWHEIQALKPRNVEELEAALVKFLTGAKKGDGTEISAEDAQKAAKFIAELYDRMIYAQANRQLQMAQDVLRGSQTSPTSRTKRGGQRIDAYHSGPDIAALETIARDIEDETSTITGGTKSWKDLGNSREDKDLASRIMRKLRMQMMQKYYADNVPVIGVLDSVEELNNSFNAIFAKGVVAGQPSLQVLIGFADRNVSSAIHEIAHALLENMPEAMQIEAMASLGFTPRTPTPSNPSIIPLEAHEKWATAFEAQILNAGSVTSEGKVRRLSSDRTAGQEGQMEDINEILEGLSPYLQDAYNVAFDNTGPRRPRSLVWQLGYEGNEGRIFLWDNMPLVIKHNGELVLAKIPLAPLPQRLWHHTGPGLLSKGSTKQFEVTITQEGHPDFGKTITITNDKIDAIGGATNGFNTRLATSLAYWLSSINARRSRDENNKVRDYKGLRGQYERYGRETPGYERLSDADKAALASMGESAGTEGTSVPSPILELKASDPEVKRFLTEVGLDDLSQQDLDEVRRLGLNDDAEYWSKRYRNADGDWKSRIADAIIDLRGMAIARKLLRGKGAVAEGYLRLQNGRYHPKLVELADAIADVIRTSRYNIMAAEKVVDGELTNVKNYDLVNYDLATGLVIMKGPKSNPKTFRVNLKTGEVDVSVGVIQNGPQAGQIDWRQTQTPNLPLGYKKWTSPETRADVGERGRMAQERMNKLAADMGAATPPQPVNYYYQIARIKVGMETNTVVAHPPTVFFQMSGGRALNESAGIPLAQANQKKRNKAVGKPIESISSLQVTPDVVEAIRNQKHNEHIMRRIDTSQLYNVRTSDLPNSHAERSAMIISKETERILAEKDSLLAKLRAIEYKKKRPRDEVKPRVYRVFEMAPYIDPETNGVALKYETDESGDFILDEDGNRIPMLDETGEPLAEKKYVERYIVTYQTITPKDGEPVIDLSSESLVRADGTPIEDKMTKAERAYKIAGRLVFYDPIDVQADGSSSQRAVDTAVNHMVSEFNRLALRAMEKYTPIVKWDTPEAGMQVWSPMSPIMKVETKTVAGVSVLLPSLSAPKQAYNFDAVGATNRWNATAVTRHPDKNVTPEDLIDSVGTNDKHYYSITKDGNKFSYQIAVTNVQTKAISIVEADKSYDSEKEAMDAAQTEYEALRAQAYLLWHQIGAERISNDILRIAELSQKDEKGLSADELAEVHNAKVIMRQYDWYRGVSREILKRYGKAGIMMADLIGATSPQTPVDANWVNAGQILQNMMRPVYERIVRDAGGAKIAYRLPFSSERSIVVYGLWRDISRQANKLREEYKVRDTNPLPWKSKFVDGNRPNINAIESASDAELTSFLGNIAPKLETKIPAELKRRQLESVVTSLIESVYWVRADGGSDPVASFVGWADRTQDWIPVSGMQYETLRGGEVIQTPIENEFMKLQRTVVPRNVISGAKFGANTDNVMQALYNSWLDIEEGVAAKARNFSLNLVSLSSGATIDVWAARYIRRAYHDWHMGTPGFNKLSDAEKAFFARIPPISESGVEGGYTATTKEIEFKNGQLIVKPPKYTIPNPADPRTSGEFGTGQAVMQMATDMINGATGGKLDMLPSDLQAVLWFTEKEVWSNAGWTNSAGAGGSFEYQMMQDIIRFGGFDRWNVQMSGNGVAHLTPDQREVTMQLLNRMVYKGYSGDQIPVGYASFMLSNTAGDQLSLEGRSQLDGMVIGYKGNTPLQPYNPETDLHLVVLNQSEKSLMNAVNGVGNASIVVKDADLGAYVGKRVAIGIPSDNNVAIIASVVPERLTENSNGTYTVVLRAPNPLTDSTPSIPKTPIVIKAKDLSLMQSTSGEYQTALMAPKVLKATQINGKSNTALFPARQPLGKHRSMPLVPPFDSFRLYESVARFVQMSGGLDGVISRNVGDLNVDTNFDPMSNVRAGFEWHFAPALSNQRIVGDPQAIRYNQQFSYLINRLQSHFQDAGEHLQMVVQNDPRNIGAGTTGIEAFIGIHGVWTPETEMRYADFGVDALGRLSDLQQRNLLKLADYRSGDPARIRQHEQRWLEVLSDFMARPDIQDIVRNDVKLIQAHLSMFDVSVIQREDVHNADIGDIAELFQADAARQSISAKLGRAIESLGIITEGDRVIGPANTQAGQFDDQTVQQVAADIQRESSVGLGLYQRKRKPKTTQGDTFHIHSTSYAGNRIAGLDSLFNFGLDAFNNNAPEAMELSWKRLTTIAVDEIDRVFAEVGGARTSNNQGIGIFEGWMEPSVDTTVVIPATATIDQVLARAAHVGLTFHQSNVFVTQWGKSKNEQVGEAPVNGDYTVERGAIVTLDKPMAFADVKQMQEDGMLGATLSEDGKTFTSFTVTTDLNADHAQRVKDFEDGIQSLIKFLETRGIKAKAKFQNIRFWNLGAEENGTWGLHREYRTVLGDIEARNPSALATAINERVDNAFSNRVKGHIESVIRIVGDKPKFSLPSTVSFRQTKMTGQTLKAIARNYESLEANAAVGKDADPVTVKAYQALRKALMSQHGWLTTRVELVDGNPYKNRWESSQDILINNRVKLQSDYDISEFHPLADFMWDGKSVDENGNPQYLTDASGKPMRYYDMMRAMYTVIADGLYNKGADEYGADVAYGAYSLFFNDPYAFWAVSTEIRGRNIASNYGSAVRNPDGSLMTGELFTESWKNVPQKVGLLPIETMGSGIESIDMMVGLLRDEVAKDHPGYNGTVPANLAVPVGNTFWEKTGAGGGGLISNPLAQRKQQQIKVSEKTNVPAGNIVVIDQDGSINADVIRDVIANEPNLDGNIKQEGVIDRLCSAIAGNIQHMSFPASVKPFDVVTNIYTVTNAKYLRSNEIPRKDFIAFSTTLWATLTDRQHEFDWLEVVANQKFMSPINKTPDGRLLIYHTTPSGQHIGQTGELLSSDDVQYMTGQGKSGLGGTPNRISYTYNYQYAVDVAKMMANMKVMANMNFPWKKMESALNTAISDALIDKEPGILNDHLRERFKQYVSNNLSISVDDAVDVLKNDGLDALLRIIDNEVGDPALDRIDEARNISRATNWMELGVLHDGLEAFSSIFGTPYAMLTPSALQAVMNAQTKTQDVNIVTYEYAIDPNMLTEHVRSEFELRTYSTVAIEPTGRIFDRSGKVIKTIDEGDITRQGLLNGHLLAQRKRNYRTQTPAFVEGIDQPDNNNLAYLVSTNALSNQYEVNIEWAMRLREAPDVVDALNHILGTQESWTYLSKLVGHTNNVMELPKWHQMSGNYYSTVDNSLVTKHPKGGIVGRSLYTRSPRSERMVINLETGTVVLQTLMKESGFVEILSHVIPLNELIRNGEWLGMFGKWDINRTINEAIDKATQSGNLLQVTPFVNHGENTLSDIDLVWFAMQLQGHDFVDIDLIRKDIYNLLDDVDITDVRQIDGLAGLIRDQIETEVYKRRPAAGAALNIKNTLTDYVSDATLSTDDSLGMDKPITTGIPNYIDIGTHITNVILHTYANVDPDTLVTDEQKFFMTIKNSGTVNDAATTEAFELTESQYGMLLNVLNDDKLIPSFTDMPSNITINGVVHEGVELNDFDVRNRRERVRDMIDEFSSLDPALGSGQLEVPVDSSGYLGTTDIVSNVGFQILNDGCYFTNHALVGLLTNWGDKKRQKLTKRRFYESLGEQLAYDERLRQMHPNKVTESWWSVVRGRLYDLAEQNNVPKTVVPQIMTWFSQEVNYWNALTPRLSSPLKDVMAQRLTIQKDNALWRSRHTPQRGPNGGILIWHGTLYGQQIGRHGAILSKDDLSSQGVYVAGGSGSPHVISTTWDKTYAFDVARNHHNLTFTKLSTDLAHDMMEGIFDLTKRILATQRGERDADPRALVFLNAITPAINAYSWLYPAEVQNTKIPKDILQNGDTKALEAAILQDILESPTVEDLAHRLYLMVHGEAEFEVKRAVTNKPKYAIAVINTGMRSLPDDNKLRNVKGWDKLRTFLDDIANSDWGSEAIDTLPYATSPASEIDDWKDKHLDNVRNQMWRGLYQLLDDQIIKDYDAKLFDDVNVLKFVRDFGQLQKTVQSQGGWLNISADNLLHHIFNNVFNSYGVQESAVKANVADAPFEAWKKKEPGLTDDTLRDFKSGDSNDFYAAADRFHATQLNMHRNVGAAYFLTIPPNDVAEKDYYDSTPVVYEYEVPEDFRPVEYNTSEYELRTHGTVGMVPTGRIYDVFGNNIAPLLSDTKDISDVLNHPDTFVAQRRRRTVRQMNPKKWRQVQNVRHKTLANEVMDQLNIKHDVQQPVVTVGNPLASRRRRPRSGTVEMPIQGPPKPPASELRPKPNKVWQFLTNAYDFMNDIGRMPLSGDMSPLTIQNWLLANPIEDPKLFFAQIGIGVKAAAPNMGFHWKGKTITNGKMMGREAFHDLGNELRSNPWYQHAQTAGLRLSTIDADRALEKLRQTNPSATLMDINELNLDSDVSMSNELTQRGLLVGASNRFFAMSKDYVKFTKFANTCQHLVDIGYVPGTPGWDETIKDFASVYNVAQGDINLGAPEDDEKWNRIGKRLWFAPRWAASRFMLDPIGYGLMSITPQGQKIIKANRMQGYLLLSKRDPRATAALLRMLMKTWALWAAIRGIYDLYYRGFGYGASESTKAGQRLRVGETIFSPPGGLDKTAALLFAMYDAANSKAYESPEDRQKAVGDAIKAQLLGNVAPGIGMASEVLFGRDLMGKPASEVYTPLQTYWNTAVRPHVNALGVDFNLPKLSNFAATRMINLATQDFLESYESLYERQRPDAGVRATMYGAASTTGIRARYAPKATSWQRKADERAPVPGFQNLIIGKERNLGQ